MVYVGINRSFLLISLTISYQTIKSESIVCLLEEGIGLYRLESVNNTPNEHIKGFVITKGIDDMNRETTLDEELIEKFNRDPYSFRYLYQ